MRSNVKATTFPRNIADHARKNLTETSSSPEPMRRRTTRPIRPTVEIVKTSIKIQTTFEFVGHRSHQLGIYVEEEMSHEGVEEGRKKRGKGEGGRQEG